MNTLISFLNTYKRPIRGGLIAAIILSALILAVYSGFLKLNLNKFQTARLEIEMHNTHRAFEGAVVKNMTVLEAIQASALAGNIRFEYGLDGEKFVIKALNGYDVKSGEKLLLYLNSSLLSPEEAYSAMVKPGDTILVKSE